MSGQPPRSLATKLARGSLACGKESVEYGQCIQLNINNLQTGICQEPFGKLQQCFKEFLKRDRRPR